MAAATTVPFLTREFRAFLREVERTARQIEDRLAGAGDAVSSDLPADPASIRDRLAGLLAKQSLAAQRERYDAKAPNFACAQYLMARLADVTLGAIPWWQGTGAAPLTQDYPKPAGLPDDVLDQVDQLLKADPPDAERAEVYLLALAAGIEPAGEDPARRERLARDRRRLYEEVARHRLDLAAPEEPLVFPDAYVRTQYRGPLRFLPDLRGWAAALILVLGGLLVASVLVFDWATAGVTPVLNAVLEELRD